MSLLLFCALKKKEFKNHQSFTKNDFFCVVLFSDINPKTKDITIDIYNYEKTEKGEAIFCSSLTSVKCKFQLFVKNACCSDGKIN